MALFSEETVVRARDALIALHAAQAEASVQDSQATDACGDDRCRAEQSALRSAVAAALSAFHPSFTHSRLSLLAGGHAVWWPDRSARVRRILFRPGGSGGPGGGDSTADSSAALAWAAPGAEGQRGAALSSSDEARQSDTAGERTGQSSDGESATNASTGEPSAARVPQFASARASLPVGLGAIASVSMLAQWGLADGQSLERRVHCGLGSAPHIASFVVEPSAPTCQQSSPAGASSAAPAAGASSATADLSPRLGALAAPVGVGLASFPAADLADAGVAAIVASQFASSPIGSAAKSIGLYSDGSLLCGGVKIRRPRTVALGAAASGTAVASFGIGDVVTLLLVPGGTSRGAVSLRAAFILHRQQLLVDGGETEVAHSELVFTGVSLRSTPRKARHEARGDGNGAAQPPSLRVRAAFGEQQLLDARVVQRGPGAGAATPAPTHRADLCACADLRAGLAALLQSDREGSALSHDSGAFSHEGGDLSHDSSALSHVWTMNGTRINCLE
jgi:hypothetical protein